MKTGLGVQTTMAQHCCVPACRSDSRYDPDNKLSFHNIPKDAEVRKRWIINIRRDEGPLFRVTDSTHVCSLHFTQDAFQKTLTGIRRLKKGALPTIFSWKETNERPPPKKRAICTPHKDDSARSTPAPHANDTPRPAPMSDHDYADPPSSTADQLEALKQYTSKLDDQIAAMSAKKFGIKRFSDDPDLIQFYTGFRSYEDLISTFNAMKPTAINMIRWSQIQRQRSANVENSQIKFDMFRDETLPLVDQFFMFMCRIRQGFFEVDLAVRSDVSVSTVSRILVTWANYLYVMLGMLPIWPERASINRLMPDCFKATYPNIRVILDCTEVRVQTPSAKTRNSEMYSNYKSHSTMKGLIGITPDGMVSFISSLYTGSVSDKEITRQCGILDLLEIEDDVMADKGFVIQDLLTPKGAKLVISPFLREKGRFTRSEVKETQEIARLRIHVERAIRRCKEYHIFDSVIPLTLAGSINQIWAVCCLLTNFHGKLF